MFFVFCLFMSSNWFLKAQSTVGSFLKFYFLSKKNFFLIFDFINQFMHVDQIQGKLISKRFLRLFLTKFEFFLYILINHFKIILLTILVWPKIVRFLIFLILLILSKLLNIRNFICKYFDTNLFVKYFLIRTSHSVKVLKSLSPKDDILLSRL